MNTNTGTRERSAIFSRGTFHALLVASIIGLAIFLGLLIPMLEISTVFALGGVLVFVMVLVSALWIFCSGVQGCSWALSIYLFVVALTIEATLRRRGLTETGLDAQTLFKIMVWAGALLIGMMNFRHIKRALQLSNGLIWILLFALWALLSTVYSIIPAYTFGGSFAFLALICFVAVIVQKNGLEKLTIPLVYACGFLTLSAIILYFIIPGVVVTPTEGGRVLRLSGLTGSPNNLGRVASFALFFIYFAVRSRQVSPWRLDIVLIALSAVACLGLSWSRTSIIALVLSIGVIIVRKRILLSIWGATALLATLLLLIMTDFNWDNLVRLVSRQGSLHELITFTGRTDIWDFAWGEFLKQPLIGYGYGSTKLLLPTGFRTYWGWTSTSAHNMLLQTLVTTGVIGTFLVVVVLMLQARDFFKRPHDLADALLVYVVVMGLFEAGAVGGAPSLLTITWLISLTIPRDISSNDALKEKP